MSAANERPGKARVFTGVMGGQRAEGATARGPADRSAGLAVDSEGRAIVSQA